MNLWLLKKFQRFFIRILVIFIVLSSLQLLSIADGSLGEKIVYSINPLGVSHFEDQGTVDWEGKMVNKAIFHTQVMGFNDTETIYSDTDTSLPLRVERDIKWIFKKEYIVEEYDQNNFTYTMKKYKRGKVVEEHSYSVDGPIQNTVLLPFYLRKIKDLRIGWTFKVRVPQQFIITLSSVVDVTVPAGTFTSYHFTSSPNKFEIWISQNDRRLPVKIKGLGGMNYTMTMKEYTPKVN